MKKTYYADYINAIIKENNTKVISDYDIAVLKKYKLCFWNPYDLGAAVLDNPKSYQYIYYYSEIAMDLIESYFDCNRFKVYSLAIIMKTPDVTGLELIQSLAFLYHNFDELTAKSILDLEIVTNYMDI